MELGVERRDGYWELVLTGAGALDVDEAQRRVTALARELAHTQPPPAFLIWNAAGAAELTAETFAWMVGASALHRLAGLRVFVAGHAGAVARYAAELGLRNGAGREGQPAAAVVRRLLARDLDAGLEALVTRDAPDGPCLLELFHSRGGVAEDDRPAFSEPAAQAPRVRRGGPVLGEVLLELGLISRAQLDEALKLQRHEKAKGRLGNLLVRLGFVGDEQIFSALEEQYRRARERGPASGDWTGHAREARENLLGNVLLRLGLLAPDGLERALAEHWRTGERESLGAVLIRLGLVTRAQLLRALERQAEKKS